MVDFSRYPHKVVPVNIQESEIEIVKYLGVYLNKLDWSVNTVQVYKKGQIRIHLNKGGGGGGGVYEITYCAVIFSFPMFPLFSIYCVVSLL